MPQNSQHRPPPPAQNGKDGVDPRLATSLIANYEALENDLQQATEMASEYQRQLAGKSNELAHMSQVFERTQQHLQSLEAGIEELRADRHRLANEAVRATALEHKLEKAAEENTKLRNTISAMQRHYHATAEQNAKRDQERDALIKQLTLEAETLTKLLAAAQRSQPASPSPSPSSQLRPHVKAQMPAETHTIDINYGGL